VTNYNIPSRWPSSLISSRFLGYPCRDPHEPITLPDGSTAVIRVRLAWPSILQSASTLPGSFFVNRSSIGSAANRARASGRLQMLV